MSVFDQIRVIFYRVHEKGLEVMLINPDLKSDPSVWKLPNGFDIDQNNTLNKEVIQLENVTGEDGSILKAIAVEADWHDIPSIRAILQHDVKRVKNKLKKVIPEFENAAYVQVKDAFKKVLPNEYEALKELKDLIREKNSITYI